MTEKERRGPSDRLGAGTGKSNLDRLATFVQKIEADPSVNELTHLRQRIEALDRLEMYLLHRPDLSYLSHFEEEIYSRAAVIQAKLEATNTKIFAVIRRGIRKGEGMESLLPWLPGSSQGEASVERAGKDGYDYLDELILGVMRFADLQPIALKRSDEMISYQPTPLRHVFTLLQRIALGEHDVLVDLGSGLGHVSLLTAICTRAHSIGIELEPAYVRCARVAAKSLNLQRVTFIQGDARFADYSTGSVFYLYTPFTGSILRDTLNLLREEASRRAIRVCTFGPCTREVAGEGWLDAVGSFGTDRISVFQSHD